MGGLIPINPLGTDRKQNDPCLLKWIGVEISEISELEINIGNLICHLFAESTNYMLCL